jgi:tRNA ligase
MDTNRRKRSLFRLPFQAAVRQALYVCPVLQVSSLTTGKTTIAVALAHLFGFAHTQSDNVRAKKTANAFHKNVAELFKSHNVVIADRNNHLTLHRDGIRDAVKGIRPRPQLVALNWSFANTPKTAVHRITCDRILGRGENHQSLRPDSLAGYEEIVWRFIKDAEQLNENEVDDVIEMELEESIEDALARAVNGVVDVLGLEKPTDEQMGEALRKAIEYQTNVRNEIGESSKGKEKKGSKEKTAAPRYYGILPEIDLEAVMGQVLGAENAHEEAKKVWELLKRKQRVTPRPHITITHMKSKDTELALWNASGQLLKGDTPPMFSLEFGHLVWNDRAMALTVENLSIKEGSATEAGIEWLKVLGDGPVRARLHITVGTANPSIPPVEAKQLVEQWKAQEPTNVMEVKGIVSQGRLKALFN